MERSLHKSEFTVGISVNVKIHVKIRFSLSYSCAFNDNHRTDLITLNKGNMEFGETVQDIVCMKCRVRLHMCCLMV